MELTIDINIELYPLDIGDKVNVILTTSLSPELTIQPEDISIVAPTDETSASEQKVSWREKGPLEKDLSDEYEYVTYGKVYKYDEERRSKVYPFFTTNSPVKGGLKSY